MRSLLGKLFITSIFISSNVYGKNLTLNKAESDNRPPALTPQINQDYFENNAAVLIDEDQLRADKDSAISSYNYSQDAIALDMGYSQTHAESTGAFHVGTSVIAGMNSPFINGTTNTAINTNIVQIWGQSARLKGFAFGAGATEVLNFKQVGQPNTFATTSVLSPTQAYLTYQYRNKFDAYAGNILITTPWVNSFGSNPGATYAMGNNTYQGALFHIQPISSLMITGFYSWAYMQYPNNWVNQQTFYNTMGGVLANINQSTTSGTGGIGLNWNPIKDFTGQLWFYSFNDYAKMAYASSEYHLDLSKIFSFDFSLQGFMQNSFGSGLTTQVALPEQTTLAGAISSNSVGAKIALNISDNTTSISYNNIFGKNGSFLNGGMVTPYTYGMEVDPLYTTPALTSIAELGSGYAYTIRNSTSFLEGIIKFNVSLSQFFVNQVYDGQPNKVTEYDAAFIYRIPHTNMNIWTRLVYIDQAAEYGGSLLQPRLIFNWTY